MPRDLARELPDTIQPSEHQELFRGNVFGRQVTLGDPVVSSPELRVAEISELSPPDPAHVKVRLVPVDPTATASFRLINATTE